MSALRCGAHLSEGDLLLAGELGHAPLKRGAAGSAGRRSKCLASPERARPRVAMADRAPAGCEFVRSKWLLSHADSRF
jgi:hypothetical protein